MTDEKVVESSAKYFKHPGWKLLAVFFQYVLGPALTAAITAYGLYVVEISKQVRSDVNDEIDRREDAELIVVRASAVAPVQTGFAAGAGTPARRPAPVVHGVRISPDKVEDLVDRMKLNPAPAPSTDDEPDVQPQEQGEIPQELRDEWQKIRRDKPDIEQLRRAAGRIQEQTQIQMQTDQF